MIWNEMDLLKSVIKFQVWLPIDRDGLLQGGHVRLWINYHQSYTILRNCLWHARGILDELKCFCLPFKKASVNALHDLQSPNFACYNDVWLSLLNFDNLPDKGVSLDPSEILSKQLLTPFHCQNKIICIVNSKHRHYWIHHWNLKTIIGHLLKHQFVWLDGMTTV